MKKYIAEFIGTFFLVLTIGLTVIGAGANVIAPLAIGAALMVMVYAGGHISGAHYNPAVTLGVLIRGKLNVGDAVPYILAQLAGAALATVVVKFFRAGVDVTPMTLQVGPALLAEFLFTFALVSAVALGISMLGLSSWGNIWIYLVANFSAAIVAAIIFNLINPSAQTTPIATDEPPYEKPR